MSAINEILIGYYKPEQYTTTKIKVYNTDGKECHTSNFPHKLWSNLKKSALAEGKALHYTGDGWKKVDMYNYDKMVQEKAAPVPDPEVPTEHAELMKLIHTSYDLKPKGLKMNELKWKYLMRSGMRGKNIMMTGPAGCGKTMAAKALVSALDRPDFYFNLGATQDPRATLVGNTHFSKETGTYFSEALFVKAIQTPNAVILLDELIKSSP
tara:strand:+ start:454 stop:1083 length:630 start_codon:yes stop_codon:yes gene_type:complete